MASNSSIEWTESTWNPVTGCTKISPGCKHCYAERMAKRLLAMGHANYANGFNLTMHEHVLELPLKWKKPQTIFVNSMSDLFHKDVTDDFIKKYQVKDASGNLVTMNDIPVVHPPAGSDVYLEGRAWKWWPVLELEKGKTYRVHLSSMDIQHGFSVLPINMNFMAVF